MATYRIVFAGPIGAGKTTAITALSDIPPMTTEVVSEEARAAGKTTTTVAFDYGQLALDSGDVVILYGTPGQSRFEFMWPLLAENAVGAVILADNRRPETVQETVQYVQTFAPRIVDGNCVIGVGRSEEARGPEADEYATALADAGFDLPVFNVDVREREQVLLLMEALLTRLEHNMRAARRAQPPV